VTRPEHKGSNVLRSSNSEIWKIYVSRIEIVNLVLDLPNLHGTSPSIYHPSTSRQQTARFFYSKPTRPTLTLLCFPVAFPSPDRLRRLQASSVHAGTVPTLAWWWICKPGTMQSSSILSTPCLPNMSKISM